MTISTFECVTVNDLAETSFIGGTSEVLTFSVSGSGGGLNMSAGSAGWVMSYLGQATTILSKVASISGSVATVSLDAADTVNLSGKFNHQLIIYLGAETYRPSQGTITIVPAIV